MKLSWVCPVGCLSTSILVRAFWNFKCKVLKYSKNYSLHNTLIPNLVKPLMYIPTYICYFFDKCQASGILPWLFLEKIKCFKNWNCFIGSIFWPNLKFSSKSVLIISKELPCFLQDFSNNDFVISLTNIRHNFWFFPTWLVFKSFGTKVKGSTMDRISKIYPKIMMPYLNFKFTNCED